MFRIFETFILLFILLSFYYTIVLKYKTKLGSSIVFNVCNMCLWQCTEKGYRVFTCSKYFFINITIFLVYEYQQLEYDAMISLIRIAIGAKVSILCSIIFLTCENPCKTDVHWRHLEFQHLKSCFISKETKNDLWLRFVRGRPLVKWYFST